MLAGAAFKQERELSAAAVRKLLSVLKLSALCIIVSGGLSWCSHCGFLRWVVAVAAVFGFKLLAGRVYVRRHGQVVQWESNRYTSASVQEECNHQTPELKSLCPDSSYKQRHRDRDAWRKAVGSEVVSAAWEKLCNSIVQEFIYDAWFGQLSPDREFPAEVRWQLNHMFGQACKRAKRQDWASLLIRDGTSAICTTLQLYRTAVKIVGADIFESLPAAEADARIREVLGKAGKLHPAFNRPDGQYIACKQLSEAVLMHIMPQEDRACPMTHTLLRELFAACVLRSTLASLAPYSINKMLLNAMAGTAPKVLSKEQLTAAAEFEKRADQHSKVEADQLNQLKKQRKPHKSLLVAVSTAQKGTPQDSVAFRSSVKRSKSLGDVKELTSRSPVRAAIAAASAAWPGSSLSAAKQQSSKYTNSSTARGSSAMLSMGQQGQQLLMESVGAVKAAAQQLALRKRLGPDGRLAIGRAGLNGSMINAGLPPSVAADSPCSCSSAGELQHHPSLASRVRGYRGVTTGGFGPETASLRSLGGQHSSADCAGTGSKSPVIASSANSSTGSSSSSSGTSKSHVVAALCGMSRPPLSPASSGASGALMQHLLFGKLQANVVSAEMLSIDGKDCIVYKVQVAGDRYQWTVTRRYRHFELLHKRLKGTPHYRSLPASLPPKRLLTARDAPFVMRRRDELDSYLQGLLRSPILASNLELAEFLNQHSEVYGMSAVVTARSQSTTLAAEGICLLQPSCFEISGGTAASPVGTGTEPSWDSSCSAHHRQEQLQLHTNGQPQLSASAATISSISSSLGSPSKSGTSRDAVPDSAAADTSSSLGACPASFLPPLLTDSMLAVVSQGTPGSCIATAESRSHLHSSSDARVKLEAHCMEQSYLAKSQPSDLVTATQPHNQSQNQPALKATSQQQQEHCSYAGTEDGRTLGTRPHLYCNGCCSLTLAPAGSITSVSQQQEQHIAGNVYCQDVEMQMQKHVLQFIQPPLSQVDSVDPTFFVHQASTVPRVPCFPPVPNRILPEPSVLLDTAGAQSISGQLCKISMQDNSVAEQSKQHLQAAVLGHGLQHRDNAEELVTTAMEDSSTNSRGSRLCGRRAVNGVEVGEAATAPANVSTSGSEPASKQQEQRQCRAPPPGGCAYRTSMAFTEPSTTATGRLSNMSPLKSAMQLHVGSVVSQDCQSQVPLQGFESSTSQHAMHVIHNKHSQRISIQHDTAYTSKPALCTADMSAVPPPPASAADFSNGQYSSDDAEQQEDMQDSTGFIAPLYELVSCAFELEHQGFVRRPVISLVRQLLSLVAGDAIDEFLQKTLSSGLSEQRISLQIIKLQKQLWPGGIWFAKAAAAANGTLPQRGPPISATGFLDWQPPADCEDVARQVRQQLFTMPNVPAPLLALVGKNAYYKCLGDVYGVLQSKTLMYNLGLMMMEGALVAMFPEIRGTVNQMHQSGVV